MVIAAFLVVLAVPAMAEKADKEIHDELNKGEEVNVIVELHNKNSEQLLEEMGKDFKIRHNYKIITGFSGKITEQGLNKLENSPFVKKIHIDRELHITLAESVPLINGNYAHGLGYTGSGIKVCVLDTGINYNHPAFQGRIVAQKDFVNNDDDAIDDHGHGTMVTGIIASQNEINKGVSPGVDLLIAKVVNAEGWATESDLIEGMEWCSDQSADVMSISLGVGGYSQYCDDLSVAQAVNNAVDAGSVVVIASGNDGNKTGIAYPSCASKAISVGATYDSGPDIPPAFVDKITGYTNRNSILDMLAPGSVITTTIGYDSFFPCQGTSCAAPHMAGTAALLLQKDPSLTPAEVETILKITGVGIYDSYTGLTFPRVDVKAALELPPAGHLESYLIDPTTDKVVLKNSTFNFTAGITCMDGYCGFVTAALNIPVNSGTPFYTTTANPISASCTQNMTNDTQCNITWNVKASGTFSRFEVMFQ